ncbi:MAG: LysR family transcriptional regulator, partial [Acetobacteraceae bacterium]|nr:LysR family transcriptional regulator [Acetobacteraceae bacterium]
MSVDLELLNALLPVAEHGSFCRKTELSRRSQSALSAQVRDLEARLGASLFHRTTRTIGLSHEGKALPPPAFAPRTGRSIALAALGTPPLVI